MHNKPITDERLALELYTASVTDGEFPRSLVDAGWPKSYQTTKLKWIRVARLAKKLCAGS